jgi:hypothetical protein
VKSSPPETLSLLQLIQAANLGKIFPKALQFLKPEFRFSVTSEAMERDYFPV